MTSTTSAYLTTVNERSLLRISTAGSVDDGKSTLIGRLLFETGAIFDDQLAAIRASSERQYGKGSLALAHITDGLRAEQEQGITIDVAYRYFSSARRRFILADAPGHEQYTRNMATAASTADVTILLVDAVKGIVEQTRRHAVVASVMGVPRLVLAINKMDAVGYKAEVFQRIQDEFLDFATKLSFREIRTVPISALTGDNITKPSSNMPWHQGDSLLSYLESVFVGADKNTIDFRLPVQRVLSPSSDYRGYAGTIASGSLKVGDRVVALPSRASTTVKAIEIPAIPKPLSVQSAGTGQPVVVILHDQLDISRGDMIARELNIPPMKTTFDAMLVWFGAAHLEMNKSYVVSHTTRKTQGMVTDIRYRLNIATLHREKATSVDTHQVARCQMTTSEPLALDPYDRNRKTGAFVLIDKESGATVAAGMHIARESLEEDFRGPEKAPKSKNLHRVTALVSKTEREARAGLKASTIWFTGLSGSGKSTIAAIVEKKLFDRGLQIFRLDGDTIRKGLCKDLGFAAADRSENIRRVSEVAKLMNEVGITVICSFVSPFLADRANARAIIGKDSFIEVYFSTSLAECERRDPFGMYKKARAGEIPEFTGISSPYEKPTEADLEIDTEVMAEVDAAETICAAVMARLLRH